MNIYLLTETETGCYKWRAAIPAKYLQRRGHTVRMFKRSAACQAPDVVVFYRGYFPETRPLVEWCKRHGVRVVYDTDDALDLVPPENLNHGVVKQASASSAYLLANADLVTTTTPELAAHLSAVNPNVTVLPNSVDPDEWSVRPRQGAVRVGWTGGATHFSDLTLVLDAIRAVRRRCDFEFVLQGITPFGSIDELYDFQAAHAGARFTQSAYGKACKRFLAMSKGLNYQFHPGVPVEQHADAVCGLALDIGIAPLEDNEFNRHKSCIKYYEYAMSGAVTLASNVLPYKREVPLVAKNNIQSWSNNLESLLAAARERLWAEQREWVLAYRNMQTNVALWEAAYSGRESEGEPERRFDPWFSLENSATVAI